MLGELGDQPGIVGRRHGGERQTVGLVAADVLALDGDVGDLPLIHLIEEIGIPHICLRTVRGRALEEIEEREQQEADHDPEDQILGKVQKTLAFQRPARGSSGRCGHGASLAHAL